MGWWSAEIMGGDTPADWQCFIREELKLGESFFDRFDENGKPSAKDIETVRALFKKRGFLWDLVAFVEETEERAGDLNIGYQVLGVTLMELGAPIPQRLKTLIIRSARNDEYYLEEGKDSERGEAIESFINDIKKYNGEPTQLTRVDGGLIAAVEKHIATNAEGLVNKRLRKKKTH